MYHMLLTHDQLYRFPSYAEYKLCNRTVTLISGWQRTGRYKTDKILSVTMIVAKLYFNFEEIYANMQLRIHYSFQFFWNTFFKTYIWTNFFH